MVEGLGVRSEITVPLEVNGQRRGLVSVVSQQPNRFTEADRQFVAAVAGWIGLVAPRAAACEQEIAVLIADGMTNEIAERLVLGVGSVANHVAAILDRLGVRNRTQLGV